MPESLRSLLLVFLGGGAGSVARWLVQTFAVRALGPALPWGTLAVNVLGAGLLGALTSAALASPAVSVHVRLAVGTGVLGGFTTYSTFNQETLLFLQRGAWGAGLAYLLVTVALSLLAGLAGMAAARALLA